MAIENKALPGIRSFVKTASNALRLDKTCQGVLSCLSLKPDDAGLEGLLLELHVVDV